MHPELTARHQLLSYGNQSIALRSKPIDLFLDGGNKCFSGVFVVKFEPIQFILLFLNMNP